jgi:hypothetical protein
MFGLRFAAGVGLTVLAFATSLAVATAETDAGIVGRTMIGPLCPVQRPGLTCTKPYQATLVLSTASHHRRVRKLRTDRNGRFQIDVPAGRYVISARHGRYPTAREVQVTVRRDRVTRVTITFDTGIR